MKCRYMEKSQVTGKMSLEEFSWRNCCGVKLHLSGKKIHHLKGSNESRPRVPFSVFITMRGFKIVPMASPRVVELPQQVGQVHLLGFGASLWLFGGAKCAVRAASWRSCMRSALSFKHFQTFQHWKYAHPDFNLTVVSRLKQRVNIWHELPKQASKDPHILTPKQLHQQKCPLKKGGFTVFGFFYEIQTINSLVPKAPTNHALLV